MSSQDMIKSYLKTHKATKCPTQYGVERKPKMKGTMQRATYQDVHSKQSRFIGTILPVKIKKKRAKA